MPQEETAHRHQPSTTCPCGGRPTLEPGSLYVLHSVTHTTLAFHPVCSEPWEALPQASLQRAELAVPPVPTPSEAGDKGQGPPKSARPFDYSFKNLSFSTANASKTTDEMSEQQLGQSRKSAFER